MRLDKLYIKEFRNLREFKIDFDENSYRTAVLGRNGTGKSNLLEALIIIFRDLTLDNPPGFNYDLTYYCRNKQVHVMADPDQEHKADRVKMEAKDATNTTASYRRIPKKEWQDHLPSYVFGYYSGSSNRMESLFSEPLNRLFDELVHGKNQNLMPLVYAQLIYGQFALLAFIDEKNSELSEFLREVLKVEELVSALFIMHEPEWTSKDGDKRFWNARGEVQKLLDKLHKKALAPMMIKGVRSTKAFRQNESRDHLYLYLPEARQIASLIEEYDGSPQKFFAALQSTDISKIINEVRIQLKIVDAGNQVTYREMSEGEQQLLMVLGLLRFTKTEEALFLLDEPDTHLNPAWSIRYFEFLEKVVGSQPNSHIILTTHNPLLISGLKKEEVQIFQRQPQTNTVIAVPPRQDPIGMGVNAILTDLFDLRSTLDLETQRKLDERRELAAQDELTNDELNRLGELNNELDGLDYAITDRDPYYGDFIKAMYKRQDPAVRRQVALTPEEREKQRQLAEEIMNELMTEEQQA